MKYQLRNKYLSEPRINRYLNATHQNKVRSKRLYHANIRLAQAFHPILTQFEVILRNSLNEQLSVYFSDKDWIINQKSEFMSDPSLSQSRYFLKKSVQKSERNLTTKGIPTTCGKIISDQNFGFWLALFLPHHYMLIGGEPIKIFKHKPPIEDRASLYSKLNDLRKFRNRTNHCEPICFQGNAISCSKALSIRNNIYYLIRWIEPELETFLRNIDNIPNKVNQIMTI